MCIQNGGIQFVIGSHHLGYLGDAGALKKFFPPEAVFCPELNVGDAVVMHCATTHFSNRNVSSSDRDIFEILLCPTEQPWRIDSVLPNPSGARLFSQNLRGAEDLFTSSRTQRLAAMRDKIANHN